MPHRYGPNQGFEQDMRRVFFFDHHPLLEQWDKLGDGIIQAHLTFVHQHHDRRASEHLRHRSDPEHVVFADRLPRLHIGIAKEVFVVNFAVLVRNQANHAR